MDYNWLFNVVVASRCQTLVEFELLICNIPLKASVKHLPICSLNLIITAHLVKSIIGILLPDLRHFNSSIIPHWGLMMLVGRWEPAGGRDRPPRTACWSSCSSAASYRPVLYAVVCHMVWYGGVHIAAHWAPGSAAFVALTYPLMSPPVLSIYISCPIFHSFF